MKASSITKLSTILGIILFTTACGKKEVTSYEEQRSPVKVRLAEVQSMNTQNQFYISGLVASDHQINISAKVMGYIESLNLEVGDKVSKGMLLARIKNQEVNSKVGQIANKIEEVQIKLQAVEKDYKRIKRLHTQQSATQKELDDITTLMKSTKAQIKQLESAKSEVNIISAYAEIKSPISGIVTAKYKNQGEMASPGVPLLQIENDKDKIIKISLPENYIGKIKKGSPVHYKREAETQWNSSKITEIANSAMHGQYPAKIALPLKTDYLSGMFFGDQGKTGQSPF